MTMLAAIAISVFSLHYSARSTPIKHNYDLLKITWSVALDPDHSSITGVATNKVRMVQTSSNVDLHSAALKISSIKVDGDRESVV